MLNVVKQYRNPPVKEAILTLSFRESIPFSVIEKACPESTFNSKYKLMSHMMATEVALAITPETENNPPNVKSRKDGFQMKSIEGEVLRIGTTNLSLHLFQPYKGWDYMINEFLEIWGEIVDYIPDLKISEISTRYINELKIPKDGSVDLKKYVVLLPKDVEGIFDAISHFFLQVQIKDDEQKLRGIVTETLISSDSPSGFSVLLDITASCSFLPFFEIDNSQELLSRMRTYKNKMFKGAITDEMEKLFDL